VADAPCPTDFRAGDLGPRSTTAWLSSSELSKFAGGSCGASSRLGSCYDVVFWYAGVLSRWWKADWLLMWVWLLLTWWSIHAPHHSCLLSCLSTSDQLPHQTWQRQVVRRLTQTQFQRSEVQRFSTQTVLLPSHHHHQCRLLMMLWYAGACPGDDLHPDDDLDPGCVAVPTSCCACRGSADHTLGTPVNTWSRHLC